jgi:hypothetical protein
LEFNGRTFILDFRKRINIVPVTMEDVRRSVVVKISIMAAVLFLAVQTGDVLICLDFLRKLVYNK